MSFLRYDTPGEPDTCSECGEWICCEEQILFTQEPWCETCTLDALADECGVPIDGTHPARHPGTRLDMRSWAEPVGRMWEQREAARIKVRELEKERDAHAALNARLVQALADMAERLPGAEREAVRLLDEANGGRERWARRGSEWRVLNGVAK